MLFIDVFIIENMPVSRLKRKILGKIYDFSYKGASVCVDYLYPSPPILQKSKENIELRKYYKLRRRIGFLFCHLGGLKFYLKLVDKIANKSKETGFYGVPSAISYEREVFEKEMFEDIIKVDFCGYRFKAPANYDHYLKNLYGDYMEIPPLEKRELHVAYKITFWYTEDKQMANIALLIAGGSGNRMGQSIPKQFLTVNERPVIIL